jgi:HPt (histidine-containing phosphotransfer) domain-containing protein
MAETLDRVVLAGLLEMVGDDPEFVAELVDTYLTEARLHLDAMAVAVEDGSATELLRPAHTLKSNSLNLGAEILAGIARTLEEGARAGSIDGAAERVAAAREEFGRVVEALERARSETWAG